MRWGEKTRCPECWNWTLCQDLVLLSDGVRYGCDDCGQGHRLGYGLDQLPADVDERAPTDFVELLTMVVDESERIDRSRYVADGSLHAPRRDGRTGVSFPGLLLVRLGWPYGVTAHQPNLLRPSATTDALIALHAFAWYSWHALDGWLASHEMDELAKRWPEDEEDDSSWQRLDEGSIARARRVAVALTEMRRKEDDE